MPVFQQHNQRIRQCLRSLQLPSDQLVHQFRDTTAGGIQGGLELFQVAGVANDRHAAGQKGREGGPAGPGGADGAESVHEEGCRDMSVTDE